MTDDLGLKQQSAQSRTMGNVRRAQSNERLVVIKKEEDNAKEAETLRCAKAPTRKLGPRLHVIWTRLAFSTSTVNLLSDIGILVVPGGSGIRIYVLACWKMR
jgi:hypothetical protein